MSYIKGEIPSEVAVQIIWKKCTSVYQRMTES